jgi:hypothetical protein
MRKLIGASFLALLAIGFAASSQAGDDKAALAVVEKAIKAMGGAENLGKVKAATWKSKVKMNFGGNENDMASTVTIEGLERFRQDLEGDFMGNPTKIIFVVNGDKGWRQFGGQTDALEGEALASQKRGIYIQAIPLTLLPLKSKGVKVQSSPDEMADGKMAAAIKVTPPEGKEFKLLFDKETGLPVKLVAEVVGFGGKETTQEMTFADYKDFGPIKKATKLTTSRDGQKFMDMEVLEFRVLDKVDPMVFSEPK